jgi:hypothetical protein
MILYQDYFSSHTPILSTCNIIWYDMQMWVCPKNTGQFTGCNDGSIQVSKQCLIGKIPQFNYFKNSFIFGLSSYFWRKKTKFQELIPESAGEDHETALV